MKIGWDFPDNSVGKESAGDPTSIPGSGRSSGEGICYPLQEDPLEKEYATHSSILGFPCGSAGKESTHNVGDPSLIPGLGRSPGEGQYSALENSMDCIVYRVTRSRT